MKHQNVIQIIDSLNPGGAEMMAVHIANGLTNKGVTSYLCSTRKEGLLKNKIDKNVQYLFLNKKFSLDINAFIVLLSFIKKNRINIIHAHSSSFFIASILKIMLPKLEIVWHDHYGNSEKLESRSTKVITFFSKRFKTIIAVNGILKDWAIEYLDCENVINIPNFSTIEINDSKRTSLLGKDGKRICCLANLRPQKDHITLLKAFKKNQGKNLGWTLHFVGIDLNDDYSIKIKNFIRKNNLQKQVFIYGGCSDIKYILSQSTIGVLSSKSEGLPLTLLEYGLAKLPVVATNVGDCGKVIINKKTGLLVNPNEPKVMANKLLYLIKNHEFRAKLGENLNQHVLLNFSKEKYLAKIIEVYNA